MEISDYIISNPTRGIPDPLPFKPGSGDGLPVKPGSPPEMLKPGTGGGPPVKPYEFKKPGSGSGGPMKPEGGPDIWFKPITTSEFYKSL
jgi:hypothetical protein